MSFDRDPKEDYESFPCEYCSCGDVMYYPTDRSWICNGCGYDYGENVT
jgi:hypothetical protein